MAQYRATKVYYGFYTGKGREYRATGYGSSKESAIEEAEQVIAEADGQNYLSAMMDNLDEGVSVQEVPEYRGTGVAYREVYVQGYTVKRKGYTRTLKSGKKIKVKGYTVSVKGHYRRTKIPSKKERIIYEPSVRYREYPAKRKDKGKYPIYADTTEYGTFGDV